MLRALLNEPHACGLGSGCVDVPPLVASAIMLGCDAVLVLVAAWQLGAAAPEMRRLGRGGAVAVVVVVLLAGAARGLAPGASQFRWDEANMTWLALGGLVDGQLPLTGVDTTAHVPNLPASVYLVAPAVAPFASAPGAQMAIVALGSTLSTLASVLCAWFVWRWTGSRLAALAAGVAFALGFWAVLTGRRPWQQNLMPPFVLLYLDAVLVLGLRRQGRAWVWAAVWLGLLVALHYQAVMLGPLLLVAAWAGRSGLRARWLALGALVPALLAAPFLYWELSGVNRLRDVRQALVVVRQPATLDGTSLAQVVDLAGTGGLQPWLGPAWSDLLRSAGVALLLGNAGVVLVGLGLLACLVAPRGPAGRPVALLLLAAVVLPVALLVRHSLDVRPWYFYQLLPCLAILVALGAVWPAAALGRISRTAGAVGAVLGAALFAAYAGGSAVAQVQIVRLASSQPLGDLEIVGPVAEAGAAAYQAWRRYAGGGALLVGAERRDTDQMRLALGARTPTRVFDDCQQIPGTEDATTDRVYFVREDTPGTAALEGTPGVRLVASVPRPGYAPFRVFVVPPRALASRDVAADARANARDCAQRGA